MSNRLALVQASDVARLRSGARLKLDRWRAILAPLLELPEKGITTALTEAAHVHGLSYETLKAKYYAARRNGLLSLVDRAKAGPGWWNTEKEIGLPDADKDLVRTYCLQNDRSCESAIELLRQDWKLGKVSTSRPIDRFTGFPSGWSAKNLLRCKPSEYELQAARKGRAAATAHRSLVYTTRAGLWVGSHIQIDDKWHDHEVNSFAEMQSGRPLELYSHDLASAYKIAWGFRVRTKRLDDGTWRGLEARMTRLIIAATFYLHGYSPRGTTLVLEHGTANAADWIQDALRDCSGGLVTCSESGMLGAAAHAGQYAGIRRGNPRHKASLESHNNLEHNRLAHLPAQVGKSWQERPEQVTAQLARNAELLAIYPHLPPAIAEALEFELLEQSEFQRIAQTIYDAIADSPEHALEGWEESGNIVPQFHLGPGWVDRDQVRRDRMSEAQYAAFRLMLESGQIPTRIRRMSRREVWRRGNAALVRIPPATACQIIVGKDEHLAPVRTVRDGEIAFRDPEIGPGLHRYAVECRDYTGRRFALSDRAEVQLIVNPFASESAFVRSTKGEYLGEIRRISIPSRADHESVTRRMGEASHTETEALTDVRRLLGVPGGMKRAGQMRRNAATLRKAAAAPRLSETERARVASAEAFMPDRGAAGSPDFPATPQAQETPAVSSGEGFESAPWDLSQNPDTGSVVDAGAFLTEHDEQYTH